MKIDARRKARWSRLVAAMLAGGTLFATCETRIHDSLITGTKNFLYTLLDPSNLVIDFGTGDTTGG